MTYQLTLSVDNNRYGRYYKCFAKKHFVIEATDLKTAYYQAAEILKKENRYKNCSIKHFDNIGNHSFSGWSINFDSGKEVGC